MKKTLVAASLFLVIFASSAATSLVRAQISGLPGLVNNIEIADRDARAGDILSTTDTGIVRSSKAYDSQMIGVIVEFPVISVGGKTATTVPLLSSGRAEVNVTAAAGAIKPGDFITSSGTPGIGQKATAGGFVLGKSLGAWDDTSQNGRVPIIVGVGYFSQSQSATGLLGAILRFLSLGLQDSQNYPLTLRYIAAAIVAIVTLILATFSFLKFMRNGIEAIGRNPLAKSVIISGMIFNGVVVGVLAIAGFGIAVAIVALGN